MYVRRSMMELIRLAGSHDHHLEHYFIIAALGACIIKKGENGHSFNPNYT